MSCMESGYLLQTMVSTQDQTPEIEGEWVLTMLRAVHGLRKR